MTKVFRKHLRYDEELQVGPYVMVSCKSTYKGDEAPELHRDDFSYTCEFRETVTPPTKGLNPADLIINGITHITSRVKDDVAVTTYPSLYSGRDAFGLLGLGIFCELKEPSISQREMFCSNSPDWISGKAVRRISHEMGREKELALWQVGKKKLTLIDVELEEL
jgi:hypothetical protein